MNQKMELDLESSWPKYWGNAEVFVSKPAIVVDLHGRILAWILPGILSKARQVNYFNVVLLV